MDKKTIAKYALSFIGGNPKVAEYYNDERTKTIDIMTCKDSSVSENITIATIGLAETNIGKEVGNKKLRVEIIMAGVANNDLYQNILSSTAFVIQDAKDCDFGMIIKDVVSQYVPNSELQHVVLLHPVFWPNYKALDEKDVIVAWLMAIPITEDERQYIQHEGLDVFERMLEEKNADISDLNRGSCLTI